MAATFLIASLHLLTMQSSQFVICRWGNGNTERSSTHPNVTCQGSSQYYAASDQSHSSSSKSSGSTHSMQVWPLHRDKHHGVAAGKITPGHNTPTFLQTPDLDMLWRPSESWCSNSASFHFLNSLSPLSKASTEEPLQYHTPWTRYEAWCDWKGPGDVTWSSCRRKGSDDK